MADVLGKQRYGLWTKQLQDKLVSLLREILKLPLPQGPLKTGEYMRGICSVVPHIQLRRRDYDDGMPWVVDQAFGRQVPVTSGNDQNNDRHPVSNGRNNQSPLSHIKVEDSEQEAATCTGIRGALEAVSRSSRSSRSSRYGRFLGGSQGELPVPGSLHIDSNDSTG